MAVNRNTSKRDTPTMEDLWRAVANRGTAFVYDGRIIDPYIDDMIDLVPVQTAAGTVWMSPADRDAHLRGLAL